VSEQTRTKHTSVAREVLLIVGVALVLSILVRTFVAQAFFVPSSSMEDTLRIQDRILASKITTRISGVERGEVVVFTDPSDWLPEPEPLDGVRGAIVDALTFVGLLPADTGEDLVKRVIGVEGDTIVCCDAKGRIVLNGVGLDEPYLKPGDGTAQVRFDITVPAGTVFVMGDNRADSADSRYHLGENSGGVPVENVVGRVVAVIWPIDNWSSMPIPDIFADPRLDQAPAADGEGATPTVTDEAVPSP
jgi:signal peptidase I